MALKNWEPVFMGSEVECSECGATLFAGTLASWHPKKKKFSCDTHVRLLAPKG
jgi:hypothetical protein